MLMNSFKSKNNKTNPWHVNMNNMKYNYIFPNEPY